MTKEKLSKRLETVASYVDDNAKLVDIGCDHGLLDIYLAQNRKNITIIASDINKNALDNAIDAVRKIQNKDDRFIFVSVKKTNNIVCLHVENSYDGKEIILENGLPLTSQDDKTSHGFGVRSIKRIVDKYKGFMNINYANNVFYLDVCFPINLDYKNA